MKYNDSKAFCLKKINLLKECVSISEELLSNIDNYESLEDLLSQREEKILELKELEDSYDNKVKNSCSESEKKQMTQIIELLVNMDKDATRLLKESKDRLLYSMKTNLQEQKIVRYSANPISQKGVFLDNKQ